jgi:hypothetical protein
LVDKKDEGRSVINKDCSALRVDGSILTFPFAENNIPYMFTDGNPLLVAHYCSTLTDNKPMGMSVANVTNRDLTPGQKSYYQGTGNLVTATSVGYND